MGKMTQNTNNSKHGSRERNSRLSDRGIEKAFTPYCENFHIALIDQRGKSNAAIMTTTFEKVKSKLI
jgi:hypothetical protein